MDRDEQNAAWLERVEELVRMLQGSTVSELELTEAGTEIIIRRQPGIVISAHQEYSAGQIGAQVAPAAPVAKEDTSVAIVAPLTGVYYAAPSPNSPPFVTVGDIVQVGQVVALVEAMKVFNEVQSEVAGRVSALVATSGDVVQKGDVLIRVIPS